jgi:hypothetical protein
VDAATLAVRVEHLDGATLIPEIASFTLRGLRRASLRRRLSRGTDIQAQNLAPAIAVDAHRHDQTTTRPNPALLEILDVDHLRWNARWRANQGSDTGSCGLLLLKLLASSHHSIN